MLYIWTMMMTTYMHTAVKLTQCELELHVKHYIQIILKSLSFDRVQIHGTTTKRTMGKIFTYICVCYAIWQPTHCAECMLFVCVCVRVYDAYCTHWKFWTENSKRIPHLKRKTFRYRVKTYENHKMTYHIIKLHCNTKWEQPNLKFTIMKNTSRQLCTASACVCYKIELIKSYNEHGIRLKCQQ